MQLWRLSRHESLNGEGGRRYGARWHSAGSPIVYLAESPPGALIEILVHLELDESELPPAYMLLPVTAPDIIPQTTPPPHRQMPQTLRHQLNLTITLPLIPHIILLHLPVIHRRHPIPPPNRIPLLTIQQRLALPTRRSKAIQTPLPIANPNL